MNKRSAAFQVLGVARSIHRTLGGDEDADLWVVLLLWIAEGLDPRVVQHAGYRECLSDGDSLRAKLRRLIEHPTTPAGEREAAVAALARLKERTA